VKVGFLKKGIERTPFIEHQLKVVMSAAFGDVEVESGFRIAEGIAGGIGRDLEVLEVWARDNE